MFVASNAGAVLRSSAVVLAIVGLSPVPLVLPSGIAVGMIGLMGGALLVASVAADGCSRRSSRTGLRRDVDGIPSRQEVVRQV